MQIGTGFGKAKKVFIERAIARDLGEFSPKNRRKKQHPRRLTEKASALFSLP
ncbi:MAG TPA: hypothetical protein VGZ93_10245 [Candidatus Methylacidiphilales bacterium]|jgi:hypothetical protein|nr:hypothetical protein [Candidatus Methylacidiphilales bacterium]